MMRQSLGIRTAVTLIALPELHAQLPGPSWLSRISVSANTGVLRPTRGSQFYSLVDGALAPGATAWHPRLTGGELRVRARARWNVVGGMQAGGQTLASISRTAATRIAGPVSQQTSLDLSSFTYIGAQFEAWHWRSASQTRVRVLLSAGAGSATYRVRQWGNFVDATRLVFVPNDFRSSGAGTIGYAGAAGEIPVVRWAAITAEWRRQAGSAPMSVDYASFDRLDLGGDRLSVGLTLFPWRTVNRP